MGKIEEIIKGQEPQDLKIIKESKKELAPEEQQKPVEIYNPLKKEPSKGKAFHEKKDKNRKRNEGGSYKRKIEKKYKKPKTRGQKRKGK